MVLGRRVKTLRKAAGVTQQAVADGAELDLKHFGAIERGHRSVNLGTLERIARALHVEPWQLLVPLGRTTRAPVADADRFTLMLEGLDDRKRETVLRVLEGFTRYGGGARTRTARRLRRS